MARMASSWFCLAYVTRNWLVIFLTTISLEIEIYQSETQSKRTMMTGVKSFDISTPMVEKLITRLITSRSFITSFCTSGLVKSYTMKRPPNALQPSFRSPLPSSWAA